MALGIGVALLIMHKRARRFGVDPNMLLDLAIWAIVGGFVGARLFHIGLYEPSFYLSNPIEVLKVWHGGLSSFGGFAGAAVGFWLFVRRKKINPKRLLILGEQIAFASLFGWMVGRFGCAAIHDHWGIPCNCPLAVQTPEGGRLDMAILEIIALLPLAIFFFLRRNREVVAGFFLSPLFIYYGIVRFVLDFFRAADIAGADVRYLGLTPAQYFAILLVILGAILWRKRR